MRTTHQGGTGAFNDTQQMSCLAKHCSSFCASNGPTTFYPEGCEVFLAWPVNLKGKCCFSERKVLGENLPALPQPETRAGPRAGRALQQQSHPLKLKLKSTLKFMNLSSFCKAQPCSGVDLWGFCCSGVWGPSVKHQLIQNPHSRFLCSTCRTGQELLLP